MIQGGNELIYPIIPSEEIIIDYYDGTVSALAKFPNDPGYFIINIIAWQMPMLTRIYALTRISLQGAGEILSLLEKNDPLDGVLNSIIFSRITEIFQQTFEASLEDVLMFGLDGSIEIEKLVKYPFPEINISFDLDEILASDGARIKRFYELTEVKED